MIKRAKNCTFFILNISLHCVLILKYNIVTIKNFIKNNLIDFFVCLLDKFCRV